MTRLIAVLLAGGMVAASVVLSPLATHLAQAGSGGGTTVSGNGATLTITVNVDLCCSRDPSERTIYGPLIEEEVKAAETQWNQALAKLPAKGCFPIAVVFSEHLLDNPNWERGYHQIYIDFIHPGRPFSNDYTPGTTHQDDTAYVYNYSTTGSFYDASMNVITWAHELGHLMGLGDDYANGPLSSVPLPGRRGTLMADSNRGVIDQVLADRLADIASKAGLKLPPCWKGTISSTSQRDYFDGGVHHTCSDAWTGTLSFGVDGQNKVTGSGALNLQGAVVCNFAYSQFLPPPVQTYDFSVSGEKTTAGFNLQFTLTGRSPGPPAGDVAGSGSLFHTSVCPDQPGPKLSINLDRPKHASGVVMLSAKIVSGCPGPPQGSQNDIFSSTSTIDVSAP